MCAYVLADNEMIECLTGAGAQNTGDSDRCDWVVVEPGRSVTVPPPPVTIEVILYLYTVAKLLPKLYWSPYMVVLFWSGLHFVWFYPASAGGSRGAEISTVFCSYFVMPLLHHNLCSCACFFNCELINFQLLDPWIHGPICKYVHFFI